MVCPWVHQLVHNLFQSDTNWLKMINRKVTIATWECIMAPPWALTDIYSIHSLISKSKRSNGLFSGNIHRLWGRTIVCGCPPYLQPVHGNCSIYGQTNGCEPSSFISFFGWNSLEIWWNSLCCSFQSRTVKIKVLHQSNT